MANTVSVAAVVSATAAAQPESDGIPPRFSDYEIARARKIERNNAKLRALGLISENEETLSNAAAWGKKSLATIVINHHENNYIHNLQTNGGSQRKRVRRDNDLDESDKLLSSKKSQRPTRKNRMSSPNRTSLRLKGLRPGGTSSATGMASSPADGASGHHTALPARHELGPNHTERRDDVHREVRRQRAAVEHAALLASGSLHHHSAGGSNPTATYAHCAMRVRTMSEKQLKNRIRIMERAAGKHCIIKMSIMFTCLRDHGLWELAKLASAALERLNALPPPPPPLPMSPQAS